MTDKKRRGQFFWTINADSFGWLLLSISINKWVINQNDDLTIKQLLIDKATIVLDKVLFQTLIDGFKHSTFDLS